MIWLSALPVAIWAYLILARSWFWWISPFDTSRAPIHDSTGSP